MDQAKEIRILRGIAMEVIASEIGRILPANEYNRRLGKFAELTGEDIEDVREVVDVLLDKAVTEMTTKAKSLSSTPKKSGVKRGSGIPGDVFMKSGRAKEGAPA